MFPNATAADLAYISIRVGKVDAPPASGPIDLSGDFDIFRFEPSLPCAHVFGCPDSEAEVVVEAGSGLVACRGRRSLLEQVEYVL